MGSRYSQSPILVARHAWVNKPDTKYNADGLYHVEGIGQDSDEKVATFKAEVDAQVDAAFEQLVLEEKQKNPKFNPKGWSKYYPYEVETDEQGAPTGYVVFKFKQNAKIKLKDGGVKVFKMGIRDKANKETDAKVFGGATIRTLYKGRPVKLATAKQFGVRLDFCMVQLIKAAPMTGGGFDEVDEAYADGASNEPADASEAEY